MVSHVICLLTFLNFSSISDPYTSSIFSSKPFSISWFPSFLHLFNSSIISLGGILSLAPYLDSSSLQTCSQGSIKIFLLDIHNDAVISTYSPQIPKDSIIYLTMLSRRHSRISSPSPWVSNLLNSHKVWTDSRLIYNHQYKSTPISHVPIVPLLSKNISHSSTQTIVYLFGKCDPGICKLVTHLKMTGFQPVLLGGAAQTQNCRLCSLPRALRHYEALSKASNRHILLIPSSSSLEHLTRLDIVWLRYVFFYGVTVVADSSLKYDLDNMVLRERVVYYPHLANVSYSLLSSLSRSYKPSINVINPLTAFLRCELFASRHTINAIINPHAAAPTGPLNISGTLTTQSTSQILTFSHQFFPPSAFRVLAIMAGFNEGDVVRSAIMDLIEQGCHVHYLDNWSTDNTQDTLKELQIQYSHFLTFELFPADGRPNTFNWEDILTKKKVLSETVPYDWIIHIDPDEIRESPWGPNITLRQALYILDQLDYNVANFANLVIFHPVKGQKIFQPGENLKESFHYFEVNSFHGNNYQLKAWKTYTLTNYHNISFFLPPQQSRSVYFDLVTYGGHAGKYIQQSSNSYVPPLRIFPLKFVLRHYPFRSQEHGVRKVFDERKSRWNRRERKEYGWHIQYENIYDDHQFVREDSQGLFSVEGNYELPGRLYESLLPCP